MMPCADEGCTPNRGVSQIRCLVSAGLAAVTVLTAAVAEADCSGFPDPVVDFIVPNSTVQLMTNRSEEEISRLAGTEAATLGDHQRHVGLTTAQFGLSLRAEYASRTAGGVTCIYPTRISVEIGYTDVVVYIARQYQRGTCQYDAIMEHETEHVRINRDTLTEHLALIEAGLLDAVRAGFPLQSASVERAGDYGMNLLRTELRQGVDRMIADREAQHGQLDSPESYARTQAECPTW